MKSTTLHRIALLDVVGISLLVPAYIWRLQFDWPRSWMIFPVWLTASFLLHGDTPKTLGWRADNLWPATKRAALLLAIFAVALLALGLALGVPRRLPPNFLSLHRLWLYFAFCLLQQVALQSFINNRLMVVVPRPRLSSLLVGAIFAVSHLPNPVLVPVTFIGGSMMAWLFARERNIVPLAVGQALVGSLVWVCFPVAWHHLLRVGPGYFLPLP